MSVPVRCVFEERPAVDQSRAGFGIRVSLIGEARPFDYPLGRTRSGAFQTNRSVCHPSRPRLPSLTACGETTAIDLSRIRSLH
jgi:hypothetical protein